MPHNSILATPGKQRSAVEVMEGTQGQRHSQSHCEHQHPAKPHIRTGRERGRELSTPHPLKSSLFFKAIDVQARVSSNMSSHWCYWALLVQTLETFVMKNILRVDV